MLSPLTGSLSPLGISYRRQTQTWREYVTSLSPVLWYQFDETSGNLINNGSAAASDGTLSGTITRGQTGQLGASEAYDFLTGSTGTITIPNAAAWASLPTFTAVFLAKFNGNNFPGFAGRLAGRNDSWAMLRTNTTYFPEVGVRNSVNSIFFTTASSLPLSNGAWKLSGFTYDDTGDRKPRIYVNGVEPTYSAQAAVTGTLGVNPTGNTLANNHVSSAGMNGLIDEMLLFNFVLSTTQWQTLTTLAGL